MTSAPQRLNSTQPLCLTLCLQMRMSNTCCLCGESSAGQFIWLSSLLRTLQTTWKDRVGVTEQQAADYQALMARMQAIINAGEPTYSLGHHTPQAEPGQPPLLGLERNAAMPFLPRSVFAADQAPERLSLSVCRACSKYTRLHHKWTDPKDRRLIRPTVNRCSRISVSRPLSHYTALSLNIPRASQPHTLPGQLLHRTEQP